MKAHEVLEQGKQLLTQRGEQRDSKEGERSMARAVRAFWILYGDRILKRGYMSETEGWEFMSILKKSRKAHGVYTPDDYLDDVNYAALAAESESNWNENGK